MKAYKVKSLIYLGCFIVAAVVYYHIEQDQKFQNSFLASQTAQLEAQDQPEEEKKEEVDLN
ncbi:hypothetical protein L0P88_14095 [Muricauda sp. SCSIO 64092]|uniref:hypothetical protein n=1 Tax=Allomuricauda sp. SCSIO 64092 TaxID=2908842 RepID=UPI001FF1ACC3|nr:hypothetical protein [Muricauda sp. SCSIO 64092]UOY05082.1 hypothetical protein L0P88_14095 [Muricauda sp. SCSIO 64092]